MSDLQKRYEKAPRQRSPDSLDARIIAHAEQHALHHQKRRTSVSPLAWMSARWMPIAASGAIAGLCALLVIRPVFQSSTPYAPAQFDDTQTVASSARQMKQSAEAVTSAANQVSAAQQDSSAADVDTADTAGAEFAADVSAESLVLQQEISELAETIRLDLVETEPARTSASADDARVAPQSAPAPGVAVSPVAIVSDSTAQNAVPDAGSQIQKRASRQAPKAGTPSLVNSYAATASKGVTDSSELKQQTIGWLQSLAPGSYVLQLSISRDPAALYEELRVAGFDREDIYLLPVTLRGDPGYASLYGNFTTQTEAYNQAQLIRQGSGLQPWVRAVSDVLDSE